MPTISVIVPTYNRADLLKEALQSVLAQTYTDYEMIVIDDGSTDNTEGVVLQLFANHCEQKPESADQIRYIKQSNAGVSAARNHGIFEARGKWLAFLDSDDLWFPQKLEKQMAFLVEHPTAGAVCCPANEYEDGQIRKDQQGNMMRLSSGLETSVLPFELFAEKNPVWTSSVLVQKTVLYKAGLFEGGLKISEDFCLWVKIARFTEFWFLNKVLGCYRFHESNTYVRNDPESRFYALMTRQLQIVRWSKEPQIVKLYERWIAGHYRACANDDRTEQNYKGAARFYWLATWAAHGWKLKGKTFAKFLIAKYFPFVFRMWDKRRNLR